MCENVLQMFLVYMAYGRHVCSCSINFVANVVLNMLLNYYNMVLRVLCDIAEL